MSRRSTEDDDPRIDDVESPHEPDDARWDAHEADRYERSRQR